MTAAPAVFTVMIMATELIVITYPVAEHAERVVETLRRLEAEHLLELADLEYCSRDPDGNIAIFESINRPLAGAALGAFWGTFLGKCFGRPLLGAGVGAASGALAGRLGRHDGIDEGFVRALCATLAPGSSAVFALIRRHTPGKVLPEVGKFGGTVLHTSLSDEDEAGLQVALDAAHQRASAMRSAGLASARVRRRRVIRHN
jgi:uncharacterized membrane protein